MLEAKYFKDYKHNYMILQCGQEAAARSYQYKILTSDKIKEILRCSVRHINGITYYYYDISSRTTLKSLYQSTKMSYEQVKDLLWQLHGICDRLAGFFMEETGLVLLPEHIYYDFSSQKYIGLYYPEYRATGVEAYEPLMNFLLEHIDTEDRQLTESMYRIYEMAGEMHFLIEDALQILEERSEAGQSSIPDQAEFLNRTDDNNLLPAESSKEEGLKPGSDSFADTEGIFSPSASTDPQNGKRRRPVSLYYPAFALFSVLGIAGAAAVYYMYDLARQEEIALYGIMAVLGVCFLSGLWGIIRGGRRQETGNTVKATEGMIFEESFADIPAGTAGRAAEDNISLRDVISKDMSLEPVMPQAIPVRRNSTGLREEASSRTGEPDYYGNTIFFDGSKVAEYKLYAIDRGNKQHIELKRFPCTIGKMAGCVDYVLADKSISRIHARFDRQEDRVLMTDMNSTNGTYKNGLRMQPQETVEIEPGDEIRFGNLNYCYR